MLTTQDGRTRATYRDRARLMEENRRRRLHQQNPFRPFHEVMADGAWAGQRCFVIGGGPSLEGFDFERLRGQGRVITINKSYQYTPFADILYFMDNGFYKWAHEGSLFPGCLDAWNAFGGHKVFLNILGREYGDAYSVRSLGRVGLSNSLKAGLYHGNNSGVGAIGLAFCLKANPIYLLGIDCKIDEKRKKSHYHSGYSKRPMSPAAYRSFKMDFDRLSRFARRTSTQIINLNPGSAVRCFPFSTIDEVLGNGKVSEPAGLGQAETQGVQNDVL